MTPVQTLAEARKLIVGRDDFREHAGDGYVRGVAFQIYDGKDGWSAVKCVVLDACASGPRIASLLDELGGPRWHGS